MRATALVDEPQGHKPTLWNSGMQTKRDAAQEKKTSSKDKSRHGPKVIKVAPRCTSLFYGRTEKNNPLRVLVNIPWHSSSLGNSIFYHNGSRRTSAWERILAELGTFQGPGLRVPFGLCRVPRMLFMEDTMPSLLLTSLE